MNKLWQALRNEWKKEWEENPVLCRVLLFGVPVFMVLYTLLTISR
jgi:hypothetical protein